MPRGVYRFLWNTIARGDEFFGFVKNLTSDGSYYWVFANVTPDVDSSGTIQGYFSVRRKPTRRAVETLESIYREMMAVEQRSAVSQAPDASLQWLNGKLAELGTSYEKFVLELQS